MKGRVPLLLLLSAFQVWTIALTEATPHRTTASDVGGSDQLRLVHVAVLFRHGERASLTTFPGDPNQHYVWPMGRGQLTNRGRQTMWALGTWIRERYAHFLTYDVREVIARSSPVPRCFDSAAILLYGLYPAVGKERQWKRGQDWQPVPITSPPDGTDKYAARNRNFWKDQGVVHEKLSVVLGPILRLVMKPICLGDQERCQKMGRVFGIYEGGMPALMVSDPELVKQVLVKDFHLFPNRRQRQFDNAMLNNMMVFAPVERWRRIRPAASPAFSTGKLRKMNSLIQECAKVTCRHLRNAAEKAEDVDVKQFYGHYTLDVIATCAFGTKLDSHTDTTNDFVTEARKAFSVKITPKLVFAVLFPGVLRALKIKIRNDDPFGYFKKVCQGIMRNRQAHSQFHEDFLQLMMEAHKGCLQPSTEGSSETESAIFDIGSEEMSTATFGAKGMTEDEALAQCVLFFLAGQDTTSSTVAFAAYLLAVHPDAQDKLRKEVDECFANHDKLSHSLKQGPEPSLDVVSKLEYLHCIVSETLRLYPPGTRFRKDNVGSIRPYTYLPFGAGPRNCIGMRFALQAVKLCLLHSVHNVEFVRADKTQVPLKIRKGHAVLNVEDITVGIRKRGRDNI
ncbi:cytochrome P450 3A41-like isoform X3 [Dermacentor variabilis]|uniref:cytochrome P450 3A41-like isoform X3 n=1 Tax=Dermacentor variabilis TaxID=34621 RepID=UPI003F5C9C75